MYVDINANVGDCCAGCWNGAKRTRDTSRANTLFF